MKKICSKCEQSKDLELFDVNNSYKDGRSTYCKLCRRDYDRVKNLKRFAGGKYQCHICPQTASKLERYTRHLFHEHGIDPKEYLKDKNFDCKTCGQNKHFSEFTKINSKLGITLECRTCKNIKCMEFKLRTPEMQARRKTNRAITLAQATPAWADKAVMREIYNTRTRLNREAKSVAYGVDHIVPLYSDLVCGLHTHHNLQILTSFENASKGNRTWPDMW